MTEARELFQHLLTAALPIASLPTALDWATHINARLPLPTNTPIKGGSGGNEMEVLRVWDAAVRCGFASDRIGHAFATGYQAALRVLLMQRASPSVHQKWMQSASAANATPSDRLLCLCATEKVPGAPPSSIQATVSLAPHQSSHSDVTHWVLNGQKSFVTLGSLCRWLLVVVRQPALSAEEMTASHLSAAQCLRLETDHKQYTQNVRVPAGVSAPVRIRLVLVDAKAKGVVVTERDPLPFIPEVPHGRVSFTDVALTDADFVGGCQL
jgi:acyl-CoA dehydrogenase